MTNYYLWRTKDQSIYIPVKGEKRIIEDGKILLVIKKNIDIDSNFENIISKETYNVLKEKTSEECEIFLKDLDEKRKNLPVFPISS